MPRFNTQKAKDIGEMLLHGSAFALKGKTAADMMSAHRERKEKLAMNKAWEQIADQRPEYKWLEKLPNVKDRFEMIKAVEEGGFRQKMNNKVESMKYYGTLPTAKKELDKVSKGLMNMVDDVAPGVEKWIRGLMN